MLPVLCDTYQKSVIYECDHAFVVGKNCATNARMHIQGRYILSIDIESFFESLTVEHIKHYISAEISNWCFVKKDANSQENKNNSILPQGFCTSPVIANIAMIDVDKMIVNNIIRNNPHQALICYSRYADDLTFSFNDSGCKDFIISEIVKILRYFGLKINKRKISFYDKKNGRAVISGIGVDNVNIYPTRKTLKKLRASIHQGNKGQERGLREWSLCKIPNQNKSK